MTWVNAIVEGILLGGLYGLFACGLSLMFGVMRIVNLAHGDFAVMAAFLASTVISISGMSPWWSLAVMVPVFAVLGYLLQRGLLQQSLRGGPFAALLATFGLSVVIQNLLLEAYTANTRSLNIGALGSDSLRVGRLQVGDLSLITFGIAVAVLLGLHVFLTRTGLGRILRATSDDAETARLVGADSAHVYGVATAIAFGTVAVAGILMGMRSGVTPSTGPTQLLYAFEAVVIGGLGSLWGTLLGGVIIGLAQTVGAQIDPSLNPLMGHLVFLAVLAFRPRGLIAARAS